MAWALPLNLDSSGMFPRERPDPFLDTARLILGVAPGERRFHREFGWRAHELPDLEDPVAREAASVFAEEALGRWAGDLGVERVTVLAVDGRKVDLGLLRRGEVFRLRIELREVER